MRINSIFLGEKMNINIPRKEHPKPQFERQDWLNLNGEWQFENPSAAEPPVGFIRHSAA